MTRPFQKFGNKYVFKNYSGKVVILKYPTGEVVRIQPQESIRTSSPKMVKQLCNVKELSPDYVHQIANEIVVGSRKKHPLKPSQKQVKSRNRKKINNYFKFGVKPSVDIIVLSKNSYDVIVPCINSIISNVNYEHCRLTIADTGTTDIGVLKFYEDLEANYENISVVRGLKYHFGKNYNELISKSKSDYVLMLNNDTVALNDFVSHMMKYIQNNKVGAVGAKLFYPDKTIQHVGQCIYNKDGDIVSGPGHHFLKRKESDIPKEWTKNRYVDGVTAACMLINKDLFLSIGGFDVRYEDIFQDVDLNLKIRSKGYRVFQCNDAELIHHDNYSRKQNTIDPNKVWGDTKKYSDKWVGKKSSPPPSENEMKSDKPTITFAVPVTSKNEFMKFVKTVEPSRRNNTHEFVFVRNDPTEAGYTSPEVLNIMGEIAEGKYVVYCHQDIALSPKWIDNLVKKINEVEKKDKDWGIIGVVGIGFEQDYRRGISFLDGDDNNWAFFNKENIVKCSGIVDEVCMIVKNGSLKFDESFDGYHFYGADASLTIQRNQNKSIWIVNCPIKHFSEDGSKNLKKPEEWQEYRRLAHKLVKKWKGIDFATTTIVVKDGVINYWLAPIVGQQQFEKVV